MIRTIVCCLRQMRLGPALLAGEAMPHLRYIRWLGRGILAFWLAGVPCLASQVRPLNVEELATKAGRIAAGRCVRVEVSEDAALGRPVTTVTILVDRTLKGPSDRHLSFRMIGGTSSAGGASRPAGLPSFSPGEEVVLFLYPESAAGLTSPVGFGQGKFRIHRDKQGRPIAVNGSGNLGLFERLSDEARGRLGVAAAPKAPGPALSRDGLLDMVNRLVSRPGGR